ncbi:hypothetical protein JTB14_014668 [Gonioctena quinquepunctata]|nr:hypothetical protein JTB14_014668 [Gonioctena quinquepunctata]
MPRTEFISFSHFNVRSLLTGFDMFSDFMQEECLDICSISETWLNQSFPSRAISVPDYNLIRKDRQGKKGGGLAFYIKKSIKYKIVDDVESFNEYKDLRNFANRCIEAEKKAFLQHKFKSDPKLFWKSLKSSNILKKSHGYDIDIDPSAFNDHFLNSVPDLHPTDNNILSKYDGIYPELKVLGVVYAAPELSDGCDISGDDTPKAVDGAAEPVVGGFLDSSANSNLATPRPLIVNSTIDSQVQIINSTFNYGRRH